MIRAAAKNWQDVAVVTSPDDYAGILEELRAARRRALAAPTAGRLAKKAFALTAKYDAAITARLARIDLGDDGFSDRTRSAAAGARRHAWTATLALRYGENPHQSAALYSLERERNCRRQAAARQGTLLQQPGGPRRRLAVDRGVRRAGGGDHQAHQSVRLRGGRRRCAESYRRAFEADPVSAFGGVLAFNRDAGRGDGGRRSRRPSSRPSPRRATRPRRWPS